MKLIYVKYRDPMLFNKPNENIYLEDFEFIVPMIVRDAGILIHETEDSIYLGEANVTEDNVKLDEWGIRLPYYRNVRVIHKSQIIERQDVTLKENKKDA